MKNLTEIDAVQFQIECGINAVGAICTAMENGPFNPRDFTGGLLFCWSHLKDESDRMRELIDAAFEEERRGGDDRD